MESGRHRDKALIFYSEQTESVQNNYTALREKMRQRFGSKEIPVTVRRDLQELKQKDDEDLEEFAERAHHLAKDGYPGAPDDILDMTATDAFLKGCTAKRAALSAMDRQPTSLDQAKQLVKNSISNQRVLIGKAVRKSGKFIGHWMNPGKLVTNPKSER